MQTRKITDAKTTPPKERLPSFQRRHQTQKPEIGRKARREVLTSAAIPHINPNSAQGKSRLRHVRVSALACACPERAKDNSHSSITSVSQKSKVSRNAARLVSQTQRVAQAITGGSNAHSQQVQSATRSLKQRRAIQKIGMQVSAEKTLLMASNTTAAVRE